MPFLKLSLHKSLDVKFGRLRYGCLSCTFQYLKLMSGGKNWKSYWIAFNKACRFSIFFLWKVCRRVRHWKDQTLVPFLKLSLHKSLDVKFGRLRYGCLSCTFQYLKLMSGGKNWKSYWIAFNKACRFSIFFLWKVCRRVRHWKDQTLVPFLKVSLHKSLDVKFGRLSYGC